MGMMSALESAAFRRLATTKLFGLTPEEDIHVAIELGPQERDRLRYFMRSHGVGQARSLSGRASFPFALAVHVDPDFLELEKVDQLKCFDDPQAPTLATSLEMSDANEVIIVAEQTNTDEKGHPIKTTYAALLDLDKFLRNTAF